MSRIMMRVKLFRVDSLGGEKDQSKWFIDLQSADGAVNRNAGIGLIGAFWVTLGADFTVVDIEPDR